MISSIQILDNMEFTDNEKYAIIAILTSIMEADRIVHSKEIEFMDEMMEKLNIRINDLDHMEINDLNLFKTNILAMSLNKQQIVKDWFQTMAKIDGNIDSRETDVINQILMN